MTGDPIHLLWSCPKLHRYWAAVANTINSVFHVTIPYEPTRCILGILDDLPLTDLQKTAVNRALFQARKLLLLQWKSVRAPAHKDWVSSMGHTLRLERLIFQHCGCSYKFDRLRDDWLAVPGLIPVDLVISRMLSWTLQHSDYGY